MTVETWIAYVAAFGLLSLLPGPSVFMVIGQSLSRGRRAALACILGDLAGGVIVMTASYLGLGLVLAASSLAFTALKWAGVAYLAALGLQQIRAARRLQDTPRLPPPSSRGGLAAGFLTGVLNPKAILFYMAFLAQFLQPAAPQLPQILILMATSTGVGGLVLGGYAVLALRAKSWLGGSLTVRRRIGYVGGGCLIGGSVALAATR